MPVAAGPSGLDRSLSDIRGGWLQPSPPIADSAGDKEFQS